RIQRRRSSTTSEERQRWRRRLQRSSALAPETHDPPRERRDKGRAELAVRGEREATRPLESSLQARSGQAPSGAVVSSMGAEITGRFFFCALSAYLFSASSIFFFRSVSSWMRSY